MHYQGKNFVVVTRVPVGNINIIVAKKDEQKGIFVEGKNKGLALKAGIFDVNTSVNLTFDEINNLWAEISEPGEEMQKLLLKGVAEPF